MNVEIIKNKNGESIYPLSHADSTLYDSTTSQTVKSKIDSICSDLSIASSTTSTTITDSADGFIRDFVAYGKSEQGENPTPTSPQDILAWDGKVHTHGKNLFNSSFTEQTKSGVTCKNNGDGSFSVVGTAVSNATFTLQSDITLKPNTTYSLNSCNHTDDANRCYIDLSNSINKGISIKNGTIPRTFTITDEQAQYPFKMNIVINNGSTFNDVFYPMLVLGSDASTFAPYHSSTADLGINLYGIKVASGGNYTDADGQMWLCDVLDYGKGTITRNVKVENLDSSLNWRKSTGTIGSYYITNWCADRGLEVNDTSSMLTHFKVVKRSEFVYGTVFVNPALNIFIGEETCPTVDDWKTWLDNNELYIAYKLAESVAEELTDEQISALRQLQTYSDGTTIEYGTLNPFATIDYWKNNINGQAVADVDAKYNKILSLLSDLMPENTSEPISEPIEETTE